MSLVEFKLPDFIKDASARAIEKKMMAALPKDIDKTEGGFAWDLTYPTALEKSELLQYHLVLALKMMFHMWADGEWLDRHAHDAGLVRREANKAYGYVTVTGKAGTVIPAGFVFSVPSDSGIPAIDFETLEEVVLPDGGEAMFPVQAVEAGKGSNVAADTITIMRSPMKGIYHITNEEAITGGAEAESDDSLRKRVDDALAGKGDSFVGNNADYVRWAMEVSGVGYAVTIPEYNGPNSVKVVVTDTDGIPANEQILENVLLHIFGTDRKDMDRLAPVGVIDYAVVAPEPVTINYRFKLQTEPGADVETIKEKFKTELLEYYAKIAQEDMEAESKYVQYVQAAAILAQQVPGVADFKRFRMNGGLDNIEFHKDQFPVTGEIEVEPYE